MSANNLFFIVGNLTKEPKLGKSKNDKVYAFVNLAVNGVSDHTDFFSVCVWGKLAETIAKYCKKGDCVSFTGSLSSTSKDGVTTYNLTATDAKFIYKAKRNEEPKPAKASEEFDPANDEFTTPDIFAPM